MLQKKQFENIFNLYYRSLCKYLFLYTSDFGMIEDAVQSVFVKLWEERSTIKIQYAKTYLFIAARNKILNELRDRNKRLELLQDFSINELIHESAEDLVDFDEFCKFVDESIEALPPKTREVYLLSREKGLSYKEIGLKQNISVNTVENHMSNALKRINEYLKSYYKGLNCIFFL